ncbi:MAG TPA: hypothetical protein VHA06_18690 [Candidatus Angelobacter sp.]|nr:hypothetical protein [Candidatus Angelobacter sp.]
MTNKTLPRMNTDGMDNQPKSKANPLKRGGTEDAEDVEELEEFRTGRKPKAKSQKPKAKSQKPKAKEA